MAYVYFIQRKGDGAVKIGVAKNPDGRLTQLQTGSSEPLRLVAKFPFDSRSEAFRAERELHEKLRAHRLVGEWFSPQGMRRVFRGMDSICPIESELPEKLRKVVKIGRVAEKRIGTLVKELREQQALTEYWRDRALNAEALVPGDVNPLLQADRAGDSAQEPPRIVRSTRLEQDVKVSGRGVKEDLSLASRESSINKLFSLLED